MNTHIIRFNVTLPEEVGRKLRAVKNKSALIAEALREKFAVEEKEKAARELEAAYRDSAASGRDLEEAWDAVSGDAL